MAAESRRTSAILARAGLTSPFLAGAAGNAGTANRVDITGSSPRFVARDGAQVANRLQEPDCDTVRAMRPAVRHCGGGSVLDVAGGGRTGFVHGRTLSRWPARPQERVSDCQARNQVCVGRLFSGLPVFRSRLRAR